MNFFKSFFASCLGAIVAFIVLLFLGFVFLASLTSQPEVIVQENSVLHLKLNRPISELEVEEPLANILPGTVQESYGLVQLQETIRAAKEDSKIRGIYLNANTVMTGFSTLQELRASLIDFRESGKWVVAYADYYSEGAYYLATACDKIYMNPQGQVEINGLSVEVMFFKKLFDKLEIRPEVFRVGDFKSAVEPFIREDLSPENQLQLTEMLQSIYGVMLNDIAEARKLEVARVTEIAKKMLVRNAGQAIEFQLIDSLFYDDQVQAEIAERLAVSDEDDIEFVKYSDYRKTISTTTSKSKNEIAVIVADGEIVPGKSDQGQVGASTISEAIRKARKNDRVKAIVIRVNSPGGVFQAADEMWREIKLATAEKPVIASMGDYAASGGYYLAMACDSIVAQPTTITGSIGVFSVLFDMSSFLDHKVGVTSQEVKTGEIGEMVTVTRPLTDVEKQIWQTQTDEIYETFTRNAAEGRHMTQEDIKKIASGRVWTGLQAKERNLVDELGSFEDAIELAARAAGVESDYKLRFYPKQKNLLERFMDDSGDYVRAAMVQEELGPYSGWWQQWKRVKTYQGTQARMPIEFTIH